MDKKMKELKALIQHLLGHNESHANEIVGLADRAKELGSEDAYTHLLEGVKDLQTSNESLKKALDVLPKEV